MDPTHSTPSHSDGHHEHNSSDLMGSAKLVAEAATSTFNREPDKVDRARVAEAASDLLDAASHYGKLEEKSYGKYVEKAEDYLRQYGSPHSSVAGGGGTGHPTPHAEAPAAESAAAAPHHSSARPEGEEHSGSGGHGDYLKMAQGLLNSGGEERSGSGGGYGDYMKMAEGFLKK